MQQHTCDKCGQPVDPGNSCRDLEVLVHGGEHFLVSLVGRDRHLYPTPDCPGSPSRVRKVATDAAWAAAYQRLRQEELA